MKDNIMYAYLICEIWTISGFWDGIQRIDNGFLALSPLPPKICWDIVLGIK